jgi:hypothetical protein
VTSRIDRKQVIRDYKARKTPSGIFAMRSVSGQVWVDCSMNLDGAKNRLWFVLRGGNFKNSALQTEWNSLGEGSFQFQILETLSHEVSELRIRDILNERKQFWTARLQARAL